MTTIAKALTAFGALGTIGGAGATTYYLLKDNSISIGEELKNKGYTLLSYDTSKDENKEHWTAIVKSYSTGDKKINNLTIEKIQGDTAVKQADINKFKKECEKIISLNKEEENNLKLAQQFCVSPIAIKDLIGKNRTVLDSTNTTDSTPQLWNNKVRDYLAATSDKHIKGINLTNSAPAEEKGKRDELKKGCDEIGKKLTHDNDYHQLLSQFEEWCSNPK